MILNAVIHHVLDEEDPYGIVDHYQQLMPSGSYLLITHFSSSSPEARALEQVLLRTLGRGQLRSREEITRFFDGLDIIEPGESIAVSPGVKLTRPRPLLAPSRAAAVPGCKPPKTPPYK